MLQRFSTGLISGEFGGQHVFSIKFDRFFFWHHAWVALAACAGAPSWTNVMHVAIGTAQFSLVCCFIHVYTVKDRLLICCWCGNRQSKSVLGVKDVSQWDCGLSFRPIWSILNFFKPDMLEELCSPENPKQYRILDWAAEKRKSSHSSAVRFLYRLANFSRAARCLAVSRGFFCLLSGPQPSFFINLKIVFFPPTWPLLANCRESWTVWSSFPFCTNLYSEFF